MSSDRDWVLIDPSYRLARVAPCHLGQHWSGISWSVGQLWSAIRQSPWRAQYSGDGLHKWWARWYGKNYRVIKKALACCPGAISRSISHYLAACSPSLGNKFVCLFEAVFSWWYVSGKLNRNLLRWIEQRGLTMVVFGGMNAQAIVTPVNYSLRLAIEGELEKLNSQPSTKKRSWDRISAYEHYLHPWGY